MTRWCSSVAMCLSYITQYTFTAESSLKEFFKSFDIWGSDGQERWLPQSPYAAVRRVLSCWKMKNSWRSDVWHTWTVAIIAVIHLDSGISKYRTGVLSTTWDSPTDATSDSLKVHHVRRRFVASSFCGFLGRLFWVNLIKWVSNVRPSVRPYVRTSIRPQKVSSISV